MKLNRLELRLQRYVTQQKSRTGRRRLGSSTEKGIEQHLFKRFGRLVAVRRFVISWLLLVVVLLIGGWLAQNYCT